jgi:hypothetical protein
MGESEDREEGTVRTNTGVVSDDSVLINILARAIAVPVGIFLVGLLVIVFSCIVMLVFSVLLLGPVLMVVGASHGGIVGVIVFVFGLGLFVVVLGIVSGGEHNI